jgi:cytochrome d ubiquinol oxidase subunit II
MLETVWFILWGVLWAGYFMLDGFDLGLGSLMPFIAEDDNERRVIYNSMGPFWDGNEVWLITAGGATFAAFPITYAVMFSSLYTPLLLILFALIIRGVAFHFRGKIDSPAWRHLWDTGLALGSFIPALLFGVVFANIFRGLPIDENGVFHGNLLTLLNPYGITGGLLFVLLFMVHGALWLAIKSKGRLQDRAARFVVQLWTALVVVAVLFLGSSWFVTRLYQNYLATPVLFIIPAVTVAALLMTRAFAGRNAWWKAWFSSSLTIVGTTFFGVAGLYPNLLPSSIDSAFSLTAFNSASSQLTLKIMLALALVMVPVVILYQIWVYKVFSHKITEEDLAYEEAY